MTENGSEYMIWFEADKCIQCYGCETACKSWRGLEYGVRYRRVSTIWQGRYPQVTRSSLSLCCLHCVEPACAAICPEAAITKNEEDGLVTVNEELCIGCGSCAEACDYRVPQLTGDGVMRKCDLCRTNTLIQQAPPCVDTCPGKALTLRQVSASEKILHEHQLLKLLEAKD